MTQDDIFLESEGDRWLDRNRAAISALDRPDNDPVIGTIVTTRLTPQNVIEIGASNGWRLHDIAQRFGCRVTAVEPSSQAIQDGQIRFPNVRFLRGTAAQLPIDGSAQFDLAIVSFVLHWVDRSTLLQSVAEIDRVLADGGFLLIADFSPAYPQRVPYHHLPGQNVWTYKQNYADVFLASNLYELTAVQSFDHSAQLMRADVPVQDRAHVAMLRKRLNERYGDVESTSRPDR